MKQHNITTCNCKLCKKGFAALKKEQAKQSFCNEIGAEAAKMFEDYKKVVGADDESATRCDG